MPCTTDHKNHQPGRRWLFAAAILALLSGLVFLLTRPRQNPRFSYDQRFVDSTKLGIEFLPNPTVTQQARAWWNQIQQRFQKPHPLTYSFPASATNRCSIYCQLKQCTEVAGVRYLIAKEVVTGLVQFGHTNTLNGAQWAAAFTDALQAGQPEWWEPQSNSFHKENLVLLTNDARTVLVLTKEMAREFQSKGVR